MINWVCDICSEKYFETKDPCVYRHNYMIVEVDGISIELRIHWGNKKTQICKKCEIDKYQHAVDKLRLDSK